MLITKNLMKETVLRTKYFEDFISIKDGKSIKRIVANIISSGLKLDLKLLYGS